MPVRPPETAKSHRQSGLKKDFMEKFPKQHESAEEKADKSKRKSRPEAAPETESVLEATFVTPEGKPAERWRHKYYDAHGEFLAEAVEERLDEKEFTGLHIKGEPVQVGAARLLKKFVMYGIKDGERVEIDVLELCNQTQNDIMVAEEPLENYQYKHQARCSFVPPLTSPLGIGVLFHEQGHAAQSHDAKYEKLDSLYIKSRDIGVNSELVSYQVIKDLVAKILMVAPEAGEILDESEKKEALRRLKIESDKMQKLDNAASEKINKMAGVRDEQGEVLKKNINKHCGALSPQALLLEYQEIKERMDSLAEKEGIDAAVMAWKEEIPALISKLEAAGFRFATGKMPPREEEEASEHVFGEPVEEKEVEQLHIKDIDDWYAMQTFLKMINKLPYENAKIEYHIKKKKMIVRFNVHLLEAARQVILDLDVEPDDYLAMRGEISVLDKKLAALAAEKADLEEEKKFAGKLMQQAYKTSGLRDIIAYPARFLERDATERAYQWAEQLKERAGIDLFKPLAKAEIMESKTETEGCEISVIEGFHALTEKGGLVGVREDLEAAAITYGAEKTPHARRKKK